MAQRSCCVPGCSMKLGGGLPLHRFPNPNNPAQIERFRTWVMKIGGDLIGEDNEFIHKNRKVCHKHFEDFYIFPNMKLTALAIPTLEIPGVHVGERRHIKRPTPNQMATASSTRPDPMDTDLASRPVMNIEQLSTSVQLKTAFSTRPVQMDIDTSSRPEHQHVRYNPLKDEWVLVSPHRCLRPWSGQTEAEPEDQPPDPQNPLLPGATRSSGQRNAAYTSTYVFPNDFPALLERVPDPPPSENPLFRSSAAKGTCRVMCFHPDSTMTIPLMTIDEIMAVINEWVNQLQELGRRYTWVQIFENKGAIMGCSNPHPHCQIWASSYLPNEPRVKERTQKEYYIKFKRPLLADYLKQELIKKERIVVQNAEWVAVVPYWAIWPYETMLLPINGHPQRLTDLNDAQKRALAEIMKQLNIKYDNLFKCSFPYSMGFHGAPTGASKAPGDSPHWLLHAMYLPPLLRSATVKKFMVGYEMLAQSQRDLTPEQAAQKLRECDDVHYKNKK